MKHLTRALEKNLENRLKDKPQFIQCILGPRQVGKTQAILHLLETQFKTKDYAYFSVESDFADSEWFYSCLSEASQNEVKIIIFDEIQKLNDWSNLIKAAWDKQKKEKKLIHWVILGSSSLELSMGLNESLAGRYEVLEAHHWSYFESNQIHKMSLEEYITLGGYPGSYSLLNNTNRFQKYLYDSIFEAVIAKDILRYSHVKKPALFRQVFQLILQYPSQFISYNKLLGQLKEAGNVDQIKYYLDLYSKAFLIRLIFKWPSNLSGKTSSPKILVNASSLINLINHDPHEISSEFRGRLFENIVGVRLCETFQNVYYWQNGNYEVDFILQHKKHLYAIEVKSQRKKSSSLSEFKKKFPDAKILILDLNNYKKFELDPKEYIESYAI